MPSITADEIITQRHKRNFIQFGGPRPGNQSKYAGQDAQYAYIDGVGAPESGGVDPIYVPDHRNAGQYRLIGRKITPPDLASATLKLLEKHGAIPRQLTRIGCQFNMYELTGNCTDLSDFTRGWSDYILIYSGAVVTDKDLGTRSAMDSDDQIEDSLSLTLADIYPVGSLSFGEQAAAQVDREVKSIIYGSKFQCGDCGLSDDGTSRIYAVVASSGAGSPGLPSEVIYSLDGGLTFSEATITGIGATADGTVIRVVGDKLVVLVPSESALYWATLDLRGVPGTFTKVTTGFATQPNDIYVASSREVYFAGNTGYIFKSTDVTAGVTTLNNSATSQNLLRIHGVDETIVATGAASTVVKSTNRGSTFTTVTTAPSLVSTNVQAVAVLDKYRYWVGTALGRLVYTIDGGETWTQVGFSGAGAGEVRDIIFPTQEVGWFSHDTATPTARVFGTWDGGNTWTNSSPRVANFPTFNRANRLAAPDVDAGIAANTLAIAGLSGGGTDGIVLIGSAARV